MARDLPAAVATAIAQGVVPIAFFAEFEFSTGYVRMWTGTAIKSWNGHDWIGAGNFCGMSPVDETSEIGAASMTFTLQVTPEIAALALGDSYRGRRCRLWLAILDAAEAVTGAYQVFGGRNDVMKINDAGSTSTISLQAENRLVDLQRARNSRYTDSEQRRLNPTDTGLRRTAKLAERPLPWGVASSPATAPHYSGGSSGGDTRSAVE